MNFDKEFIVAYLQAHGYEVLDGVKVGDGIITAAIEYGCECESIDQEYRNVFKILFQNKLLENLVVTT